MWTDDYQHICDNCGKSMQASDIGDSTVYDLCNDCCSDQIFGDEIAVSDGNCVECGKWSTITVSENLCSICYTIYSLDKNK